MVAIHPVKAPLQALALVLVTVVDPWVTVSLLPAGTMVTTMEELGAETTCGLPECMVPPVLLSPMLNGVSPLYITPWIILLPLFMLVAKATIL